MAHALHHAESSARRFGGRPEDYLAVHEYIDSSKMLFASPAHRALRHHATGIWDAERLFGIALTTSAGRRVPTRLVAERHVREDLGRIPSLQDWLAALPLAPWMLGGRIEQGEDPEDEDRSVERWRAEVAAGRTILGWIEWTQGRGDASAVRPFLDVSTGCLTPETRARLEALDEADAPSTLPREGRMAGWSTSPRSRLTPGPTT